MQILERLSKQKLAFIRSARIGHLATGDLTGQPHVIPICFVFDGRLFLSPIDEKPKRTTARQLKRVRNIIQNPQVSLVIDRYDEDWAKLGYMLVAGKARILSGGEKHRRAVRLLRRKYRQYQLMEIHERPMILITPRRIVSWGTL